MAASRKRAKILETRFMGLLIGILLIGIFLLLSEFTSIFDNLELKLIDVHFRYKEAVSRESIQEGVSLEEKNINISEDILIIGIDNKSLSTLGKWPFPRYRQANLLDSFARISDQNDRELALFLDIFFIEPSDKAHDDALLAQSIEANGRVFLETVLDELPSPPEVEEEYWKRHDVLYAGFGEIKNITGDWANIVPFFGVQPPLQPFGAVTRGYGHANFDKDFDGTFRRQALIAKTSVLIDTIRLDELSTDTPVDDASFERLEWVDRGDVHHTIPYPLTKDSILGLVAEMERKAPPMLVDTDNDGTPDESYFVVRKYRDHFVPAITLALAVEYFNKTLDDIEVVLGKHILIRNPEYFDTQSGRWIPYRRILSKTEYDEEGNITKEGRSVVLDEIRIPIDDQGRMLINFMGPPSFATAGAPQTFPIRSFSGYVSNIPGPDPSTWPRTKAVGNKILMVGPFARGMAADEKHTPYGLMYGVEIHANALNTIIMNNFLHYVPWWMDTLILAAAVMLVAFMSSRLSTIWSMIVTLFIVIGSFIAVSIIFDQMSLIVTYGRPAIAVLLTFLTVVVYRVMTEEKDKRRIKDTFGKYVSPSVVDQILENPPELGGVDRELTVFFSDIRGFTTPSESMAPQDLVNFLNIYLTAMTDIVLEYKGTLDKYEGDAIMCFWGAPIPLEDHALLACKAALKQMEKLESLNREWPQDRQIHIGIGINTGIMTVGNMGSPIRMDYTIMGDAVNLGARLEGQNKTYTTNIIMSEFTYAHVKDRVVVRELDMIRVKGKNKPVLIYELLDLVEQQEETPAAVG